MVFEKLGEVVSGGKDLGTAKFAMLMVAVIAVAEIASKGNANFKWICSWLGLTVPIKIGYGTIPVI